MKITSRSDRAKEKQIQSLATLSVLMTEEELKTIPELQQVRNSLSPHEVEIINKAQFKRERKLLKSQIYNKVGPFSRS